MGANLRIRWLRHGAQCFACAGSARVVRPSYGSALEYRLCAQAINNLGDGGGQRTVHGASAGAFVAAAAEVFGHSRDIHFALASQADSKAGVGKFAEKYGDLNVGNGERVVNQPFAILLAGVEALHLFLLDRDPCHRPFAMQIRKGGAEQTHLRRGVSKIDVARTKRWLRSGENEFTRHRKRVLVSTLKHEGASVSHQRGVEAGGNVPLDGNTCQPRQPGNKFGGRHNRGIETIDMGEISTAHMVVDIDEKTFVEPFEERAPGAVAFQKYDGIVRRHVISFNNMIGEREILIDARHAIMHYDVRVF